MFNKLKIKEKDQFVKVSRNGGFTLIELMVSLSLFAIVIVIILGSIITVMDSNKKARSLMTVMNNLNFSVDSMVRSFKTGQNPSETNSGTCFETTEINYRDTTSSIEDEKQSREVEYCFETDNETDYGKITKFTQNVGKSDLTSPDIDIDSATFDIINADTAQPLLIINLQGTVMITASVSSAFSVQTSVSQRQPQR